MPVSGKEYLRKIILKNYEPEEAYVVILMNPKAGILSDVDLSDPKEARFFMYARLIKEWNFTNEKGETLPITPENVKNTLSVFDFTAIDSVVNIKPGLEEEKKTTTSTASNDAGSASSNRVPNPQV